MTDRGRPYTRFHRIAQKAVTTAHQTVYAVSGGRIGSRVAGNDVAVLTTTGRKSGKSRAAPLFAYPDGEDYIVVASNGGTAGNPSWFFNLQSDPRGRLKVGAQEWAVQAEVLSTKEKAEWWPRVTARYKTYDSYQRKTDRDIPMVRLRRVR